MEQSPASSAFRGNRQRNSPAWCWVSDPSGHWVCLREASIDLVPYRGRASPSGGEKVLAQKPLQCLQLCPPAFSWTLPLVVDVCVMIWISMSMPFRPIFPAVWGQGLHLLCPLLCARSCSEGLALGCLWSRSQKSWCTALGKLGLVSGQEDRGRRQRRCCGVEVR